MLSKNTINDWLERYIKYTGFSIEIFEMHAERIHNLPTEQWLKETEKQSFNVMVFIHCANNLIRLLKANEDTRKNIFTEHEIRSIISLRDMNEHIDAYSIGTGRKQNNFYVKLKDIKHTDVYAGPNSLGWKIDDGYTVGGILNISNIINKFKETFTAN